MKPNCRIALTNMGIALGHTAYSKPFADIAFESVLEEWPKDKENLRAYLDHALESGQFSKFKLLL